MATYWETHATCARCEKKELVEQPGQQPEGWVVIAYVEKKFDPRQPKAPPEAFLVPYPFCGPACAALFALTRAWGSLKTKDEKGRFMESLRSIKWWPLLVDDEVPN